MKTRWLAGLAAAAALLAGCGRAESSSDFYAMDTFMSVTVYGSKQETAQALTASIEQEINALDRALSRHRTESEISALNAAEGMVVTVSDETYAAIERAVQFAEWTDGAYDPTTAPLSDLWGIGTEAPAVPAQADIDDALTRVGWQNIELFPDNRVCLHNGAQLDLGGIGKGWATDKVHALCADTPGVSVLARLGGNILGYGENPNSKEGTWNIGVADPDDQANVVAAVAVRDESVVTSGDYERFFEQDGRRYHHIFDPETGYPADSGLRSVTVVSADSTEADALTTALFVMGLDKGMAFAREHELKAIFVTSDKQIYTSPAMGAQYTFRGETAGYTDAS